MRCHRDFAAFQIRSANSRIHLSGYAMPYKIAIPPSTTPSRSAIPLSSTRSMLNNRDIEGLRASEESPNQYCRDTVANGRYLLSIQSFHAASPATASTTQYVIDRIVRMYGERTTPRMIARHKTMMMTIRRSKLSSSIGVFQEGRGRG